MPGLFRKSDADAGAAPRSPEVRQALDELRRLVAQRPFLAGPAAVVSTAVHWLDEQVEAAADCRVGQQRAQARLREGVPLLRGEEIALDTQEIQRRFSAVGDAIAGQQADGPAAKLAEAARRGDLEAGVLVKHLIAGEQQAMAAHIEAAEVDVEMSTTALRLAVFADFCKIRQAMSESLHGIPWEHGCCPVCGGWPLLAELRGLQQERFLRCGLCAAGWRFPRLKCPYCQTRDHHRLGFLAAEEEENARRVATCEACGGYAKTVSTLAALSPTELLVMDLATMHLDLVASDHGFQRP